MVGFQAMVCFKVKEGPRDDAPKPEEGSLKKTFKIILGNKQLLIMSLGYLIYDIGSGILGALIYNLYYLDDLLSSEVIRVFYLANKENMKLYINTSIIVKNPNVITFDMDRLVSNELVNRIPVTYKLDESFINKQYSCMESNKAMNRLVQGDVGSGKTAIAVDTIINQKNTGVICIYGAIG